MGHLNAKRRILWLCIIKCCVFWGWVISKYFGTDGFRGEAGVTITAEHAFRCGRVLGWYFGVNMGRRCRAVIGKDTRISSYMLEYAFCAGFTASGGDAYILHVTTTPSVSYIARCDNFDCGVMISASHNPFRDNGIKLFNSRGEKLTGGVISLIERYLDGDLTPFGGEIPFAVGKKIGKTVDYISGRNRYTGHLISLSTCSYKEFKVGLDGANGSAFSIARSVFDALGAETYAIGVSPDGFNVNGGVGSTHIEALQRAVEEKGLNLGFAFDGDADRCIAVDASGRVITGDEILYILANYLKARGELNKNRVVCTVLSNGGLIKSLKAKGVECVVCGVGDYNVSETMEECGAMLGGERSGHIIIKKYESTGDGLLTAVMLMEAVINSGADFASLLSDYAPLEQVGCNLPVRGKSGEEIVEKLLPLAEELEKKFNVRTVIRASGTERVIRIMAEGENAENCAAACKILCEEVEGGTN